jgi:hypothetical protein
MVITHDMEQREPAIKNKAQSTIWFRGMEKSVNIHKTSGGVWNPGGFILNGV